MVTKREVKTGKQFELLVHRMYQDLVGANPGAVVTLDDKVPGRAGNRQIDLTVRHTIAGIDFLTIIECKDYSRPLNQKEVDAIVGKAADVKANKAILVSSRGFSKSATLRARAEQVDLCVVGPTAARLQESIERLPVVIKRVGIETYATWITAAGWSSKTIAMPPTQINNVPFERLMFDAVEGRMARKICPGEVGYGLAPEIDNWLNLTDYFGTDVHVFRRKDGGTELHHKVMIGFRYQTTWHFGTCLDLTATSHLINLTRNEYHLTSTLDEIVAFTRNVSLVEFQHIPEYARNRGIHLILIEMRPTGHGYYRHYRKSNVPA
jgi:hypothetical protein